MIVIFGAGEYGREIRKRYFWGGTNVVFYDNDRRKWGSIIDGLEVIDFQHFLALARKKDTEIIIGIKDKFAALFLKDVEPACQIKAESTGLAPFDLRMVDEFPYDNSLEVGVRNLQAHLDRAKYFKVTGKIAAYDHAVDYINFYKNHLQLPEISSLEFTNNCNLKCPNCPNSTLTFHKGFMSDEVFGMAFKYLPPYKDDTIAVHCMGEPLLHPKFLIFIKKMAEIDVNICISTNGLLLDDNMGWNILSILSPLSKAIIYISFHTKKSVESWFRFLQLFRKLPSNNILVRGQVLEHNKEEAYKWLKELGVKNPSNHPYIRHISSHSFAGNVPGRRTIYLDAEMRNRIRKCYYLRRRKIAVMWDGTLRGCCYDSNAEEKCGDIFDYENAAINPMGYELCKYCDPDWITDFQ